MQESASSLPARPRLVAFRPLAHPLPAHPDRTHTILLRLEACIGGGGWLLSQIEGQSLLRAPMNFGSPSAAVTYAKEQCSEIGCSFVIRTAHRQTAAVA